jgi:hypothetical protein
MQKLLSSLTFVAFAASLSAQNCFESSLGTALGSGDEAVFAIQPIGFTFPLAGQTFTDVHVTTNGHMYLSNAGTPAPGFADFSATAAEFVSGSPRIAALWNDLNFTPANAGQVFINSTPGKCTVTWQNAVNYGQTTVFTIQAQLFPTGEVRFFYGPGTTNNSTQPAWQVGITGVTSGGGATLPAASDLSLGVATTDNTIYEEFTAPLTFDMASQTLAFLPTAPGWVAVPGSVSTSGCASTTDFGTGCVTNNDSFYELMPTAAFDLGGLTITMFRQPDGYLVLSGIPGAIVAPSATATIIANADDTVQTVPLSVPMPVPGGPTNALTVSSNGNISLAAIGNGNGLVPDVPTFLGWAVTNIAAAWHDLNPLPAGSGKILFEEVGGIAYVTWDNVYSYATTSTNRFQYQFNLGTGDVTIVYDVFVGSGNTNYLMGYSIGGPSNDPGATDLSVGLAATLTIKDFGTAGLALTTNGAPSLGNSFFQFELSDVPPVVPLAFLFLGDASLPGLPLDSIGMPGCFGYSNANLTSAAVPVVGGSAVQPLPIPIIAGLVGATFVTQGVAFSLDTPLNLVASNGNTSVIGF